MLLIFILLFSFNNATASESTQYSQEPIQLAEKFDTRRRGMGCGTPPSIWAMGMCKIDSFCYANPEDVILWLPPVKRTEGSNFITVKNLATQQEITKRWQISDTTIPWPIEEVPLTTETNYSIRLSNRNGVNTYSVILNMIPSELSKITQQIEWMKEKGCTQQAEMFLNKQEIKSEEQDA
ncbi:hypothetical protein QUF74_05000 [Candidatus Halobeggiatoa sp. HSG11]|nr:hypothetical protein [Candidatus Halobeggiatoa sp. HSG11]